MNIIKKNKIIIIIVSFIVILFLLLLFKNNSKNDYNYIKLNEIFTIKKGETVILKEKEEIKLTLTSVEDNRCPMDKNIQCVWQGEIKYNLLIDNEKYVISTYNSKNIFYEDYKISIMVDDCGIKCEKLNLLEEVGLLIERND